MSAVSGPNAGRTVAHVLADEELLPARYIAPPDLDILSMSYSTENSPYELSVAHCLALRDGLPPECLIPEILNLGGDRWTVRHTLAHLGLLPERFLTADILLTPVSLRTGQEPLFQGRRGGERLIVHAVAQKGIPERLMTPEVLFAMDEMGSSTAYRLALNGLLPPRLISPDLAVVRSEVRNTTVLGAFLHHLQNIGEIPGGAKTIADQLDRLPMATLCLILDDPEGKDSCACGWFNDDPWRQTVLSAARDTFRRKVDEQTGHALNECGEGWEPANDRGILI